MTSSQWKDRASTCWKFELAWAASASSPFYAADWKGGDKAAWEAQIRTRNQGQNDYAR